LSQNISYSYPENGKNIKNWGLAGMEMVAQSPKMTNISLGRGNIRRRKVTIIHKCPPGPQNIEKQAKRVNRRVLSGQIFPITEEQTRLKKKGNWLNVWISSTTQ